MCRFVYITADRPLPTPEPTPLFRLAACDGEQVERVRSVALGRSILAAYSWQGCGCGFCYESGAELAAGLAEIPEGEPARATAAEWRENGRGSVAALRAYLSEACRVGPLGLYVAWAGEEGQRPHREAVVTPDDFGGDAFCLREGELFTAAGSAERHAEPGAAPDRRGMTAFPDS
jgi:hypothetical protein